MTDSLFSPRSVVATLLTATLAVSCGDVLRADDRQKDKKPESYAEIVGRDEPIVWWRMSRSSGEFVDDQGAADSKQSALPAEPVGKVEFDIAGPTGEEFPDFDADNKAVGLSKGANYLRVSDPGDHSPLDFDNGDSITIEAWVRPATNPGGSYGYIVGKGRTHNPGFDKRNQNYALRLLYSGRTARLSFLFMDAETPADDGTNADGHRWNSTTRLAADDRWHHVALMYTFGEPDSIRGYIDGAKVKGRWELAGPTKKRPVVDNDELWIGSTMGGKATFAGEIDEVALYRRLLAPKAIARHANIHRRDEILAAVRSVAESAAEDHVQFDVFERVADVQSWQFVPTERQLAYRSDVFALTDLPRKYNDKALIVDRAPPLFLHAYSRITLPAGRHRLLLRSLNAARLYVDDRLLVENPFLKPAPNGHGRVYKLQPPEPGRLSLPAAHHEKVVDYESDGKPHVFSLVALAGLQKRPAEFGELVVAFSGEDEKFRLLGVADRTSPRQTKSPAINQPARYGRFDDEGWLAFLEVDHHRRQAWESIDRQARGTGERDYWDRRHAWAAREIQRLERVQIPDVEENDLVNNTVDQFIQQRLETEDVAPTPLIDDLSFFRRVTLDCTGVIPTTRQIEEFLADPPEVRRAYAVDRLLESPGWADHWVGYWQHVLAENPGLTKPTLNNSGPFRWHLYESFLDNKPFDRFVTELVLMESGRRSGGPAGFAQATNNDVPMAAKAHIVGTAFLGVQMKCARCHDSPMNAWTQQDLFGIAAMLGRKPLTVPASSTVPATPEQLAHMAVTVSLKPGQPVKPHWPFEELSAGIPASEDAAEAFLRNPGDSREQLAWRITHPANRRFPQVIVNRMWERYLGRGLVQPVHDWESGECSHPELLAFLADELVLSGYDLKHVARLIFNSQTYQRAVDTTDAHEKREALFASPTRRRMTAEQLADSIFLGVGKSFDSEPLTMNADGRQVSVNFLSLGIPRRAWQFACVSNERERPSMSLPRAQSVVDLMMAYGWRQNRQEPVNERVKETTPLTPLLLANGVAVSRGIDISDNGQLVELCLENQTVEQLVDRLFLRFLSRKPDAREKQRYTRLLAEGYNERATGAPRRPSKIDRSPLTWSNNLDAASNRIGEERQVAALKGDPPTARLTQDWRERAEDVVWVLINSPEFAFVP